MVIFFIKTVCVNILFGLLSAELGLQVLLLATFFCDKVFPSQ